jgi:signal transduction histidine kinase/CheY-like chemotaxis protein
MVGAPAASSESPADSSRAVLDFIHRVLTSAPSEQADLAALLGELAAAFHAPAAGLASLRDGQTLARHPAPSESSPATDHAASWDDAGLRERVQRAGSGVTAPLPQGGTGLLTILGTADRGSWLLWLEDRARTEWSAGEAAALVLAGHALTRLMGEETLPRWGEQLDRSVRQRRLEEAANVVRRLAHDFGNVLTGILGFSELALAQQVPSGTPLHAYLTELYRGAQNGAQYTNQLRLFARRQSTTNRSCSLSTVLAEEETRLRAALAANVQLTLDVPADLPAAAVDAEQLRQALAIVLDNAREAISGPGAIAVSVRSLTMDDAHARALFGSVRPGNHLEITVADTGTSLTADAQRQLFSEPFFSTKPRKRGFGLAIAYGILSAHKGGIDILRRPEGGVIARIVIPAVAVSAPVATSPAVQKPAPADKVLVVDDDPMILQFVTTTLERAGYRVQAVGNADEAVRTYTGSAGDPFRLVLSDVLMPQVSGVDLAKRLLALDANVRVLFMSGQVPAEFTRQAFAPGQFDLLPKPFRPEGLVRAVRAALDRVPPRRGEPVTK